MKYRKFGFLATIFMLCTAEGCPSRCERQSDCGSDETCRAGYDADGHEHDYCFPDHPTATQVNAAQSAGWRIKKITVGTSGASAEIERD